VSARLLAFGALAAALAWSPQIVYAHCGGGGGGGGHGGGGHGGSSSGPPQCVEHSDVVGHQTCTRFGSWDATYVPALTFELGGSLHLVDGASLDGFSLAEHDGGNVGVNVTGTRTAAIGTGDLRVRLAITRNFYLGVELGIGGGPSAPGLQATTSMADATVRPSGTMWISGGFAVGARIPLGAIDLRAELLLGGALATSELHERYFDCENYVSIGSGIGLVEPRVAIDWWVSPWMTLGVVGGVNLAGPLSDAQVGVAVGFHARPHDGG